jgi:signal transduction histidine kinase
MLRAAPEKLSSRTTHWFDRVHPEDRDRVMAENRRAELAEDAFHCEYRLARADGSYVWVQDECVPVRNDAGEIGAWQGILLDVSERVRLEQELRQALEAAQAANRARSHFLAMMSHELRTPMQAVLGYADLLLIEPEGSLTTRQLEDIHYIRQGAGRMISLVGQMLDLSRLEAGRLELAIESVDLGKIIEQVRQDVAPQAAAKGVALSSDLPPLLPPLRGDPLRLHQILLNLAGNAVKFTEQGTVTIAAVDTGPTVDVAVSDTGIGIASDILPHVFEEFRQADSGMTRRHTGAGLGLAIAKRLAEQHGGLISAVSVPNEGSTFTLHLPCREYSETRMALESD